MARKPKPTAAERRIAELRKLTNQWTRGDREQSAALLVSAIIQMWSEAEPAEAARQLFDLADLAKRAAVQRTAQAQIKALELQLVEVSSDKERERLTLAIERLKPPPAPSPEARRLQALARKRQRAALLAQRPHAQTTQERKDIEAHIYRLDAEIAADASNHALAVNDGLEDSSGA